ncbi:MAG: ribonuclease HII [Actinobacteria bacterium HGW-Actinobacteria-7]|nr:MAG: ribonuclease HII [Actinobacteria bacterium HGW-Actinobacteria-7]
MTRDPRPVSEIDHLLRAASGVALERLCRELADDDRAGVRHALAAARAREGVVKEETARLKALYELEARLAAEGFMVVAGVDEVGRGALAGPLSAGACVLPAEPQIRGLNDSKKLSSARREELAVVIKEVCVCWSVAHVEADEIDSLGMSAALRRAMGRALAGLDLEPDHVVVDGLPVGVSKQETAVVKGDSKVAAIAAASILAKVTRDALMVNWAERHPEYGFEVNKGYGTAEHFDAISRSGLSPLHRRSFAAGGGTQSLF